MAAMSFILSNGCTEVFEIVCVVVWPPLAVDVLPCLNTISDDSLTSAEALPFRDAFAELFCDVESAFCVC